MGKWVRLVILTQNASRLWPGRVARGIIIGHASRRRLLLVSYVEGADNLVRIISARQPTPRERSDYEKNRGH